MRAFGTAWLFVVPLIAAQSPYAGSEKCAECHAAIYRKQSGGNHARALRRIEGSRLAELLEANPIAEPGGYRFQYTEDSGGLRVAAIRGSDRAAGMLEWAFGTGQVGMTAVGRYADGRYFEHRVSYYAQASQLGITPGQPLSASASAVRALGAAQPAREVARCFRCHATGVEMTESDEPQLSAMVPGVQCERCHGPGRAHVEAARAGKPSFILNPGRFPAKASVEMCGDCHRLASHPDPEPERTEPISIRFQPIGLMASRCFQESRQLRCTTCHDPHADAVRNDSAYYTTKCLTCHAGQSQPAGKECRRGERADCLGCHMRKVSPYSHFAFTDHRIRVR